MEKRKKSCLNPWPRKPEKDSGTEFSSRGRLRSSGSNIRERISQETMRAMQAVPKMMEKPRKGLFLKNCKISPAYKPATKMTSPKVRLRHPKYFPRALGGK